MMERLLKMRCRQVLSMKTEPCIALVGNPNSGKTTLFNRLTGASQHVGNWPGVTVEKKEGTLEFEGISYRIVDLPGIYSLGAFSEDEVVARDYILSGDADVIINVIEASNLERNLYLTTQLLEMGKKIVIALNMADEADKKQITFDLEQLSKRTGAPVIKTVALRAEGQEELIRAAIETMDNQDPYIPSLSYSPTVAHHIHHMEEILDDHPLPYPLQWTAVKLVEGDKNVLAKLQSLDLPDSLLEEIEDFSQYHSSETFELDIVDSRYSFAHEVAGASIIRPEQEVVTLTDKIDRLVTNKYLGIPIFAVIMLAVFQLTFVIGQELLGGYAADLVDGLGGLLEGLLVSWNSPGWLVSFMIDGVINGVGAVVEFVPLITVLYLLLGLLEDSGYMARAAYVWDDLMRKFGLQGKSFISMIIGFGCNVPGIMSARTLDSKKDRMITMLIAPFMSCGAKLPIYSIFIAAFFPSHGGLILFGLYALGIVVALLLAKLFSVTLFQGEASFFIMEMPPYRLPAVRNVLRNMWNNLSGFVKRAGTVIFLVVTLMWILAVLPASADAYGQNSLLGRIGTFLVPIFSLAGFGTWQEAVALFAGIPAKEAVVGTLGMLYAGQYMEEGQVLVEAIRQHFTPLTAMAYMVMVLLYTPCAATLGIIGKETKSVRWPVIMAIYTFAIGWLAAVLVFQVGSLLGFS